MKKLFLALGFTSLFLACKQDVEPAEENELITTVELSFTDSDKKTSTFSYSDPDGDGGAAPTIDKIALKANKTYELSIKFLDKSKTPTVDLTSEILAEADEHLVVYTLTPTTLGTYTYTDKDKNGFVIGLKGTLKTNGVGLGVLKVQLRHQPPVNGVAVKNGSPTPGSDDVNLNFDLSIAL